MRSAFDRWIEDEREYDAEDLYKYEDDPLCSECHHHYSDHPTIVVPATENDWAYDQVVCPTDPRVNS